jgi:pyruvate dehydrogenase E1 component
MIAAYLEARFTALGADGFGRSDTRQALRAFFEVGTLICVVSRGSATCRPERQLLRC